MERVRVLGETDAVFTAIAAYNAAFAFAFIAIIDCLCSVVAATISAISALRIALQIP